MNQAAPFGGCRAADGGARVVLPRPRTHVLRVLLAMAATAGCDGSRPDAGEAAAADQPVTEHSMPAEPPQDAQPPAPSDSLRLSLEMPERVSAGARAPIVLVVENVTDRPLDLYLRGRTIAFDLIVTAPDGAVVWRRLEDEVIPAIVRIETLPAGGRLELRGDWDQRTNAGVPVAPGEYLVRGELLTEGEPLVSASSRLGVTARSGR